MQTDTILERKNGPVLKKLKACNFGNIYHTNLSLYEKMQKK